MLPPFLSGARCLCDPTPEPFAFSSSRKIAAGHQSLPLNWICLCPLDLHADKNVGWVGCVQKNQTWKTQPIARRRSWGKRYKVHCTKWNSGMPFGRWVCAVLLFALGITSFSSLDPLETGRPKKSTTTLAWSPSTIFVLAGISMSFWGRKTHEEREDFCFVGSLETSF